MALDILQQDPHMPHILSTHGGPQALNPIYPIFYLLQGGCIPTRLQETFFCDRGEGIS